MCPHKLNQFDQKKKTNRPGNWKIKFKHESSQSRLSSLPLPAALSPQPSNFLNKQKTLVCSGKWTAHIPVKIHIAPSRAGEQGRKEKLNSSTNAYLFPILAPLSLHTPAAITARNGDLISPRVYVYTDCGAIFWWETVCCSVQGVSFLFFKLCTL